ncbi:hypothetical protein M3J09_010519 [Ascochyta lentis]
MRIRTFQVNIIATTASNLAYCKPDGFDTTTHWVLASITTELHAAPSAADVVFISTPPPPRSVQYVHRCMTTKLR